MDSGASTTLHGPVSVIRFRHAPVNTLAYAMRCEIYDVLREALRDEQVRAVVLTGEGRGFCAGAQITEFASGEIALQPTAHDIWALIEASPKPVIAAIHGYALGGGLEFAMACHYWIATRDAKLGAPEVKLGLLPGAGGTQRLPRAVGVERALSMMLEGRHVQADEFADTLMIERFAGIDLLADALALAGDLIARQAPLQRLRDLPVFCRDKVAYFAAQKQLVDALYPRQFAPAAIVECVEAAVLLPFEEGLKFERKIFQELLNTEQSKALRAAFFAERRSRK